MARRPKLKIVPAKELTKLWGRNFEPVQLDLGDRPPNIGGCPAEKVYGFFASGDRIPDAADEVDSAGAVFTVGGFDQFRYAEPKDGVRFNKDHFEVVWDPSDPNYVTIIGPLKDGEHWTNELSPHLKHFAVEKIEPDDDPGMT